MELQYYGHKFELWIENYIDGVKWAAKFDGGITYEDESIIQAIHKTGISLGDDAIAKMILSKMGINF